MESTDNAEKAVTHIFINEYETPGERNEWRGELYSQLGGELNIFTFPLEGTLHLSPLILSDLPEAIAEARQYTGDICLGSLYHSSGPKLSEVICLPREAFANQGLTLGIAGTGKTNTDCVLVEEALKYLNRVIIIDGIQSHSFKDKEASFSDELKAKINYITIEEDADEARIGVIIKECNQGCHVLQPPTSLLSLVLSCCLREIESGSPNKGNDERVVDNLLLVEEANDAIGQDDGDRRRIVGQLETVLNKAYRMGWCIWLSTQRVGHLGYDEKSSLKILAALKNKIIHQCEKTDVNAINQSFEHADINRAREKLDWIVTLPKGAAMITGATRSDDKVVFLPPILAWIRQVSKSPSQSLVKMRT